MRALSYINIRTIHNLNPQILATRILLKKGRMSDSFPPEQLRTIAQEVSTLLKEKKETVAVAETVRQLNPIIPNHTKPNLILYNQAAGGLISASILSTPGASTIYRGGLTVSFSSFSANLETGWGNYMKLIIDVFNFM